MAATKTWFDGEKVITKSYSHSEVYLSPQEQEASAAYDKIDRLLRNSLGDTDYAEYSAALDALYTQPATNADAKDARIAELEKDAARYRWLRDKATTNDWAEIGSIQAIPPSKIDAAIDAAMKEKP